jgi:Na(+)-translocating NADH:ubiquinone oxidoreductase F subunit
MPATIGLRTYKVEAVNEKVVLDLSAVTGKVSDTEESEKTFRVVSNRNLTPFIREVILSPSDGTPLTFLPGQYVQMKIPPYKVGFKEFQIEAPYRKVWDESGLFDYAAENTIYSKRNYSLAGNPSSDNFIKLIVRIVLPPAGSLINAGAGSSYVFNLKPGNEVQITGPFGDFLLKESVRELIYLGGGAGMAPLRSHLSYLFETVNTTRKVSFWYGARSSDDLFYREYFEKMEADNPNFSFHVSLSEPKPDDNLKWNAGFIHEYLLTSYLAVHNQPGEIEYYLCGPPAMIEAALKMLKSLGVPDDMIAYDEF